MAITVLFDIPNCGALKYDEVMRRLDALDLRHPKGRRYHVASPQPGGWYVVDVWDDAGSFETFAQTLVPILVQLEIEATPKVLPTHNIVTPA